MKTNHQRGFKGTKPKGSHGWSVSQQGPFGVVAANVGYNFTKGHRGMAKDRRGAKKFVRSRIRCQHKKLAQQALAENR